jgi:hypothetical protein
MRILANKARNPSRLNKLLFLMYLPPLDGGTCCDGVNAASSRYSPERYYQTMSGSLFLVLSEKIRGCETCPWARERIRRGHLVTVAVMINSKGGGEVPDKNPSPLRAIGEGFFTDRDKERVIGEGCLLLSTG